MDIVQESFSQLYPERALTRQYQIRYSGRFKDFNAHVRHTPSTLEFSLSRRWRPISREIQVGLIQELLNKVFRTRVRTGNIDLYNLFIKNLHLAIPKTKGDPLLSSAFQRLNERFFASLLEEPNFRWGSGIRRLGSYEYQTDTITVSAALKDDQDLLEYVMHHEMLHKKLKFSHTGRFHTAEFRRLERAYPGAGMLEKRLQRLAVRKRMQRAFWPF